MNRASKAPLDDQKGCQTKVNLLDFDGPIQRLVKAAYHFQFLANRHFPISMCTLGTLITQNVLVKNLGTSIKYEDVPKLSKERKPLCIDERLRQKPKRTE